MSKTKVREENKDKKIMQILKFYFWIELLISMIDSMQNVVPVGEGHLATLAVMARLRAGVPAHVQASQ